MHAEFDYSTSKHLPIHGRQTNSSQFSLKIITTNNEICFLLNIIHLLYLEYEYEYESTPHHTKKTLFLLFN